MVLMTSLETDHAQGRGLRLHAHVAFGGCAYVEPMRLKNHTYTPFVPSPDQNRRS